MAAAAAQRSGDRTPGGAAMGAEQGGESGRRRRGVGHGQGAGARGRPGYGEVLLEGFADDGSRACVPRQLRRRQETTFNGGVLFCVVSMC